MFILITSEVMDKMDKNGKIYSDLDPESGSRTRATSNFNEDVVSFG